MLTRKALTGALAAAAVAGSALVMAGAPAAHAADADDTTFTPVAADVIGVGSDTSQNAMFRLANAYNAATPAPAHKLATFAATGGGQITLPTAAINRPNGSGAGKTLLYGAANNTDVDYARSSSGLSTNETNAGLQQFPFALDTLKMAVSGQVASHAPTTLTPAQVVGIYSGTYTDWSQLGGTAGTIKPLIPQAGSGTRSFFVAQLQAANANNPVTLANTVTEVQEHDSTPIKGDADAIAPFSAGRAGLEGTALRLEGGFSADRALYNVVRSADLGNADIQALFGEEGFVCSDAARPLIEAAGFKQLATAEDGGVCGAATQAATNDFTVNTGPAGSDDTAFVATSADVIGVGSDTSQNALFRLANSYNATTPAPAHKLATFAATGGGQIPLPTAAINRPNGSGAGKTLLYGAANNTDVEFARSSSGLSTNETNAGLQQFPFALDTLKMAVSGRTTSHAPVSLTPAQIVGIYNGTYTNWSQLGGTVGVIKPMIPQAGSGTRSFFVAQLQAANANNPVTLANTVTEVQEHDPAPVQNDADAIAPFSAGRAGLTPGALRLEEGFSADRALYNVVRSSDLANADIQALFAEDGYLCSDAARADIIAAGFEQLARPEDGGVCGQATQAATTDFDTNNPVVTVDTTTTVTGTSTAARSLRLTARVSASSAPEGTVTFTSGETVLGTATLRGGTATLTKSGLAPRVYDVVASYQPTEGTTFVASSDETTVKVKTSSSITETFASTVKGKASTKGVVTVKLAGVSAKATGKVVLKEGNKNVATGTLKNGKVTVTLTKAKLGNGKSTVTISWGGNGDAVGTTKKFTITFKAAPKKK